MAQPDEYIRFQNAKEAIRQARALKASGNLEGAFELLCRALDSAIADTDDDLDELESRYHELDGRIG